MTTNNTEPRPPSARALAVATAVAAAVAALVLVVAVLPAEYGIDPTGVGAFAGFTRLSGATADDDAGDDAALPDSSLPASAASSNVTFTFDATWPLAATEAGSSSGYAAEGETATVTLPVERANVTAFTATLAWTDANATAGQGTDPDYFELVIEAPDGTRSDSLMARNDASGAGRLEVTLRVRDAPAPRSVESASAEEARARIDADAAPDASGAGDWRVHVTLVQAGGARVGGIPIAGAGGDAGNDWNLTTSIESFALELASRPGSGARSDSRTFTLPAGGDVEFKLHMDEGETMRYAWSAVGGRVYVDFHGEPDGAAADVFTSHRSGTLEFDEAVFEAPFTGRHGWYWRNDGASSVTVTLDVAGRYDVIGIV